MADHEEKPIRVVDRRMFTADGELRPDFQPEDESEPSPPASEPRAARAERPPEPAPPAATAEPGEPGERGEPGEAADLKEPRTAFGSMIGWIATNAYAALGLLPDAAGRSHRDLTAARQMVDWLAVLEQKTRNNLSFEESDFLSRVLYELRLAFVEISRRPAK
jgi:uncharacterized protein DUF1844